MTRKTKTGQRTGTAAGCRDRFFQRPGRGEGTVTPSPCLAKNEKNSLAGPPENKKGGVVFEIIHDKDGGGMA